MAKAIKTSSSSSRTQTKNKCTVLSRRMLKLRTALMTLKTLSNSINNKRTSMSKRSNTRRVISRMAIIIISNTSRSIINSNSNSNTKEIKAFTSSIKSSSINIMKKEE